MAQKADAWREYREAAMVEMLLDTLPKVSLTPGTASVGMTNIFLFFPCRLPPKWLLLSRRPGRLR